MSICQTQKTRSQTLKSLNPAGHVGPSVAEFVRTGSTGAAQQGSTLIIGLILLFVMAVLTLSSLSGVVTQERRAANSNLKNHAENAAMSAVASFRRDFEDCRTSAINIIEHAIDKGAGITQGPLAVSIPNNETHTGEVWVTLLQQVGDDSNSMDNDKTTGTVGRYHIEIRGRGTSKRNGQIIAEVSKGFQVNSSCRRQ